MSSPERLLAELDAKAAELRELTAEVNGTLKDIRDERRRVEKLLAQGAEDIVNERLQAELSQGLDEFSKALEQAIGNSTDSVYKRFDSIYAMLVGEDPRSQRRGLPSIPQLIEVKKALDDAAGPG